MYAIFENGGKQYQVKTGDLVNLEKINAELGDKVIFENVLLLKEEGQAPKIGRPFLKASIESEVVGQDKDKKIVVFTFKRRKGHHKTQGHRQPFTCVKILKIGEAK